MVSGAHVARVLGGRESPPSSEFSILPLVTTMTSHCHRFLLSLLLCSLAAAQSGPPASAQPVQPTLPQPAVKFVSISWSQAESPIGFQVNLRGRIDDAGLAHRYEVRYQLRLHRAKGAEGPILGDAQNPGGRAVILGEADAPDAAGGCDFDLYFDLTRKELGTLTGLQPGRMLLRVEPQIFDLTAGRYLTPPRSDALIAVAEVSQRLRVDSLVPFARWFAGCHGQSTAGPALALFASLDALDFEGNAIIPAFEEGLQSDEVQPQELVLFLDALPAKELAFGKNNLSRIVEGLLQHRDAGVQAAAAAKQKQAQALQAERH